MALVFKDRVLETSQTSGTGTLTLAGPVNNFQSFSSAIGNGNTTYYAIVDDADNQWEVGIGTVSASALSRDTVYASSNGDAKVNFGASIKQVFCDYPASKVISLDSNGNPSFGGNSYQDYASISAPSYLEGRTWYDSTAHALAYYNDSANAIVHIGQDLQIKVINNTGSTIANGSPVYITGTSSGQTYPNVALAKADVAATSSVIGLTNGAIANGAIGYVTGQGTIDGVSTGTFTVGQVLYLSPYSAGQLMNTIPPTGITVQVGVVSYVNSSAGKIYVKQTTPLAVPASIITGVLPIANGGTNATTASDARTNLGLGTIATQNANAVAITGGTIDNTPIGATTPSTGTFTTITGQTEVLRGTGQNFLLQSQTFENASWVKSNSFITADQVAAPDGTTTADYFYATSPSAIFPSFSQAFICTTNQTYTFSLYVRSAERTTATIQVYGNSTTYINGYDATGLTSTWTRITLTVNSSTYTSLQLRVLFSSTSVTWTGSQGIYIWGAQAELASTAGTYLATTTTAVYGTPTLSFSGVAGLGLQSDGSLYVSPAGTGALQAQATTSSTVGGNARGANAVDWQTTRNNAIQVASGAGASTIGGGSANIVTAFSGLVAGGTSNQATSGNYVSVLGGYLNVASGTNSSIVGGYGNTSTGFYNFIGGGYTNLGTANAAVTTQSATMNATTAVTLAATNASIKVGQLITGTSITSFPHTYVAAISGTSLTLSQAASGSSTSTLSFFTPHGVVVGGGNNQATGAYSAILGGGDAGTAANRNVASGDWSTVAGGFKNSASAVYSSILGGSTNTIGSGGQFSSILGGYSGNVSNSYGAVIAGYGNTSSGDYSVILNGTGATGRGIIGSLVYSASNYPLGGGVGYCQSTSLILARQTTDATATVLTSNSSAAGGTNQVILPNNSAYFFKGEVISGVTGGGNTKGWTIEGVIKRGANAASTALVGTPTVTSMYADVGAATWTIAVTADTTNGGLAVTFTGQASTTIRTICQIRTTEMTY